jgi:dihydrofolate synthase/folylpolyglutamate synthase
VNAPGNKLFLGQDFGFQMQEGQWSYWGPGGKRGGLAYPALRGRIQLRNAAAALCALDALRDRLPLAAQDARRGLAEVEIAGRFQVLPGRPQLVLDVAHNPQAALTLADNLGGAGFSPETIAVCGMLRDKDIGGVLRALAPRITRWHLATLPGPRGASAETLERELQTIGANVPAEKFPTVEKALEAAAARVSPDDKIVVFGSFLTVGEAMAWLKHKTSKH